MISFGGISLQIPAPAEAAWLNARINPQEAFSFFRPRNLGDAFLNPRPHFNWVLNRPFKVNAFFNPWGASRFGYAFVLADRKMLTSIVAQNGILGQALPFRMDDNVGSYISTPLFMLPPVPLSKINVAPQLPLFLLPLVDERFRFWERADVIDVLENVTTWTGVFASLASALEITLSVDPISADYLKPSNGLTRQYQYLPLMLDLAASSVGQRIVRTLDGAFYSRNPGTANSLMIAQTNQFKKFAGGTLSLGVVDG